MKISFINALFSILVMTVSTQSIQAAETVGHDEIDPIVGTVTAEQLKFLPRLHVLHGCDYSPAVSSDAKASGGLKASGTPSGNCSKMKHQVYVRDIAFDDGTVAYMYAYYFAKDHSLSGWLGSLGHRHDWENVVVWTRDGKVIGAAYSQHGDYVTTTTPTLIDSTHISVDYFVSYFTHSLRKSSRTSGGSGENLISFSPLSSAIRSTLNNHDWGNAVFPMGYKHFANNIEESRPF